jgi:DNA-directed RNA polymerase subunit M/transcription elongation factor TFIIS
MTQKNEKRVQFDNMDSSDIFEIDNNKILEKILINIMYKEKNIFSHKEINILKNIIINGKNLTDNTNIFLLYEIISWYIFILTNGFTTEQAFSVVIDFLRSSSGDVRNIYFSLPLFNKLKDNIEYNLDNIRRKHSYEKGIYKCINPKCLSDEVTYTRKQTRCSDEPETVILTCQKCGRVRSIN